jgi:predicted peptidase
MKLYSFFAFLSIVLIAISMTSCGSIRKGVITKKTFAGPSSTLPYQMYYPKTKGDNRIPVIIFLHGSGERGSDNIKQGIHVVPYLTSKEVQSKYPCIVIAPQCPENDTWSPVDRSSWKPKNDAEATEPMKNLFKLVEQIKLDKKVEPNRIYIIGLSMGGFGTYDALSRDPQMFAAAAPICGGSDVSKMINYAHVPLWIFHGAKDPVVPASLSDDAYKAFVAANGYVKYTEYPEGGHDVWENAVREQGFLDWLFSQYKGKEIR